MNKETNKEFTPYIPADKSPTEFTWRGNILGILLAVVFGAGNAYLGLKVGMTISASIPAAVMSMAILRSFFKGSSVLENNIVQTIGSSGESLAAGVIFTIPALIFLGDTPSSFKIFWISLLGGLLGVLFMIPLRRYLIVQEHGKLPFPEGTACAEILKAGEQGGTKAWLVVWGGLLGGAYKFLMSAAHWWVEVPNWTLNFLQKTLFSLEAAPSLLGVGFIIGPRISATMLAGAALGWWVLIPLIKLFGSGMTHPLFPATILVPDMSAKDIWSSYIRYIGAGAVATGGMVSLIKAAPIIVRSLKLGFKEILQGLSHKRTTLRTEDDLPMGWVLLGSALIILALWLTPGMTMNFLSIAVVIVMGFFFVTVASLSVGLLGSSTNPVSGMTITTLLVTCLLFVAMGWTDQAHMLAAMMVGAVVCIAICMAGDNSQDLKTGYILGATPKLQQIANLIGVVFPATVMGATLYLLHSAYGLGSDKLSAPQATLMSLVVKGVLQGNLPWILVIVGLMIGACVEMTGIGCLPFAIGLYLPLSLSTPIMVGGLVAWGVEILAKNRKEAANERGILLASGLVAGDALTGVLIALLVVTGYVNIEAAPHGGSGIALGTFMLTAAILGYTSLKKSLPAGRQGESHENR
ncbi:MAG: oligopeptide transporter, OPT family [Elusimicrobia bacterium]|nr:oligopeptide transporter, OPT family [Elusimicrobiota bacterium]